MTTRHLHPDSPWLLALLAALVALGPLSVDVYLPAMPTMMVALDTDIRHMHLTLSSYLTGFALFHLACGPLADRFGRKPILIGGTVLFVAACVGCSLAETVDELVFFRFIQGIGACVGPTLARAVARDVFGPTRAARALSLIAMMMALAPAIAPAMGGVMMLWLPWPSIFVFLAVYGIAMIMLIHVFLGESLPRRQSLHPLSILVNYGTLLRSPMFLIATFASGFVYAGFLAYLASSSFVYIDMLGVPVEYFGLTFITSVIGYMAGSGLSARLSRTYTSEQLVLAGAALAAMGRRHHMDRRKPAARQHRSDDAAHDVLFCGYRAYAAQCNGHCTEPISLHRRHRIRAVRLCPNVTVRVCDGDRGQLSRRLSCPYAEISCWRSVAWRYC